MYSEGNNKSKISRRKLGIQIIGGGTDTINDKLGASEHDGGITPLIISPFLRKKSHLGGQNVVFERDSNINGSDTPQDTCKNNIGSFPFQKDAYIGNNTPGIRGSNLGLNCSAF
jgi:hypothetical protein